MLLFGNKSHEMFLLFQGVLREITTHFIVDVRALNKVGGNHVKIRIISPSGTTTDNYITDKGDGTYRVEYTAFEDGKCLEKLHCHLKGTYYAHFGALVFDFGPLELLSELVRTYVYRQRNHKQVLMWGAIWE